VLQVRLALTGLPVPPVPRDRALREPLVPRALRVRADLQGQSVRQGRTGRRGRAARADPLVTRVLTGLRVRQARRVLLALPERLAQRGLMVQPARLEPGRRGQLDLMARLGPRVDPQEQQVRREAPGRPDQQVRLEQQVRPGRKAH
jgi:hypothetical protein